MNADSDFGAATARARGAAATSLRKNRKQLPVRPHGCFILVQVLLGPIDKDRPVLADDARAAKSAGAGEDGRAVTVLVDPFADREAGKSWLMGSLVGQSRPSV